MHRLAIVVLAVACGHATYALSEGRPGLGTTWGETRSSIVREVSFERASSVPFAQTSILYDDRQGLSALTRGAQLNHSTKAVFAGVEALVVGEDGVPLESAWSPGRIYVVGEEGERYRLRIRNRTSSTIEVVASVDGLDVMDGQRASLEKRGYLVEPRGTLFIDGFRRSQGEVAAFRFGAVSDSYAARTGDDRNVGVIGFAFFDERGRAWDDDLDEADRRRGAQPFSDSRFARPPEW